MPNIQTLFKDYLDYLEIEKNRSIKTRENYEHYLNRFSEFTKIQNPENITDEEVRKYRIELNRLSPPLSKITQNYHIIALRNFLKYLAKREIKTLSPEKIELARIPQREIDILGYADLERLLKTPQSGDLFALRDKAILETLFSTGLRVSELVRLNRDSIDLKRKEFSVRGKGGKIRVVFLSPQAVSAIKNYLEKRGDIEESLFVSANEKNKTPSRLTSRTIERLIKKYATQAGIAKKVTPHSLRHLFATDLLQNGADLRSVQSLLGHANVSTTQIYTHFTDRELKEIHQAFHGKKR
ncbi:MAG: tyrosine-type recombinase/integrase [Parcubacteria group bacterium]|nr:tyrosine-type recombinase/integrase [Parcubacteria group bacterium]